MKSIKFNSKRTSLISLAILFLLFTSCQKELSYVKSKVEKIGLKVSLTVTDTYDYDDIKVRIKSVEIDTSGSNVASWFLLSLVDEENNNYINIHTLRHGNETPIGKTELRKSRVKKIRLGFDSSAHIVKGGVSYPLFIPDSIYNKGFTLIAEPSISSNSVTAIGIEWTVSKSIIFDSVTNRYTFHPVMRTYNPNSCGSVEGFVKPDEAMPVVTVFENINNSSPTSANFSVPTIPYQGGYFKLIGVPPGKYSVQIKASKNAYVTTQVNDINVIEGITTHIGTFTLR